MNTPAVPGRTSPDNRSGGEVLVDQLLAQGVATVFCVPGESYLAVLDALHNGPIRLVTCRHEGGAAMMAEADGKLSGRPGIVMVTRGPGATNASAGVHVAHQDSTPMILFVGQIARGDSGRGAFQEVDYTSLFGTLAKAVMQIDEAARIPEVLARAWQLAMSGRPGPVVIALPEDMLRERVTVADAPQVRVSSPAPSPAALDDALTRLLAARSPLLVAGGSRWTAEAAERLVSFAERFDVPVATAFRRQMLFPADHPLFVGDLGLAANPQLVARLAASDCLLALGTRLGDITSQGYTALPIPDPGTGLIHVYPDAAEMARVYIPDISIVSTPGEFLAAAAHSTALPATEPPLDRAAYKAALRAQYLAWSQPPQAGPGNLHMGRIIDHLNEILPADAIITNGAGNYATWVHRYYRFRRYGTQLAPVSGSMGYGLPAAIAARLARPDQAVIAFAGDGCFMMTCQEWATAVQHGLPLVLIVVDNGMLGTIRMHQERHYPGRVSGTDLLNPDFVALARAMGGQGERIDTSDAFPAALRRALDAGGPALIHCPIDPQAITPTRTLAELSPPS